MPFIEENDLLDLHKDIEKAQIINERLLDQIKFKNKDLKKLKIQRYLLIGVMAIFLIGALGMVAYFTGVNAHSELYEDQIATNVNELEETKQRLEFLKEHNEELSLVKEYYLARKLLDKEKVYSVQVKSLIDSNIPLSPGALTNTHLVKTNPYFAYSIGTFETLEEAQKFRLHLVDIGFNDAFVASYQNGKRLQIERPD